MNKVEKALKTARFLVAEHLPHMEIEVKLSRSKKALGTAKQYTYIPNKGQLLLSKHFLKVLPENEILDTILHGIAHLKVGVKHGHNHVWKAACREVGANPERLAHGIDVSGITFKYDVYCPTCQKVVRHMSRKPKHIHVCTKCGSVVRFRQNY